MAAGGVLNEAGAGGCSGEDKRRAEGGGSDSGEVLLLWKSMAAALYHIEANTFLLSAARL